jgi:hypothetical protein
MTIFEKLLKQTVLGINLLNILVCCIMAYQLRFWLMVSLVKKIKLKGE